MRIVVAIVLGLSVVVPTSTGGHQEAAAPSATDLAARDLAVYRALLTDRRLTSDSERRGLVVTREIQGVPAWLTVDDARAEPPTQRLRTAAKSTVDAFASVVRETGDLPDGIRQLPGVVMVTRAELARLERRDAKYWQRFRRRYRQASGVVSLSRIGYAADGREAIAILGYASGYLGGHGYVVVLQQVDGKWLVVEHQLLWES